MGRKKQGSVEDLNNKIIELKLKKAQAQSERLALYARTGDSVLRTQGKIEKDYSAKIVSIQRLLSARTYYARKRDEISDDEVEA